MIDDLIIDWVIDDRVIGAFLEQWFIDSINAAMTRH